MKPLKRFWRILGPGFITGAADDDPTAIATYAQSGALYGYGQAWTQLFSYPFMVVVQEMCGRIGMVTGRGLAAIVRQHYSRGLLFFAVGLLCVANTINIGADLGAMAAAVELVVPVSFWTALIGSALICLALEVLVPYPRYAAFLRYLALVLLAYVLTAFITTHDWGAVFHALTVPHIEWSKEYLLTIAAILGGNLSPYLFFWQTDEEVEEEVASHRIRGMGKGVPHLRRGDISRLRLDTFVGMLFSNVITFFMLVTAGSTLFVAGIHHISTAQEAAAALRPLAGDAAYLLFTIGIIATTLLAVPVLAGSAGYALSEALGWKASLGARFAKARGFYIIIVLSTLLGLLLNTLSIPSMTLLIWAAAINGLLAPPLIALIIIIGNDRTIMGKRTNPLLSTLLGWFIVGVMSVVAAAFVWSLFA
jgi:NRAMP (natural resistance-associated macrophage protein)-like metal ion transporter